MLPDRYRYVVVEGPIGAGKTSLARRLAQHFGAAELLEKPDENPFLEKFYRDPARYALATQLFFLFQRGDEVRELAQMDMFRTSTVADYLFDKDTLFARLNLNDEEFALYQQIYRSLQLQAPEPDLVIYLQAAPQTLVERVRRRAKPYEQEIADEYLLRLAQSYSDFFYHYDAAPVLMVNSDHLNFVDDDDDFTLLLRRIGEMRGQREFFSMGRE
ncbi:MAG: deoxyadenosine kinase [Gallionellales bacterium GWA2_60_18]|nr:MAG: deoxyadenosine kinase [Gallionellales bacterium GWA2_60_18]